MSFNMDTSSTLDTETFALAVAEEMAIIEANKAELIAHSKREAAVKANEAAAMANAEADEAERIARVKRDEANSVTAALFASKTMVEAGLTGITVDDDDDVTTTSNVDAGRTHASKAARRAEKKATMKVHHREMRLARKAHAEWIVASELQRRRDYEMQEATRRAEVNMRVQVEVELERRGLRGSGGSGGSGGSTSGKGGGGTNAGVVACFLAGCH